MYVGCDQEQQALRQELRDYYAQLLTPEVQESLVGSNGVGPAMRKVVKQMGTDGWLGIGWPPEYGGKGKTQLDQFIFFDESMRAGAPVPMLTINTVGPTIFRYGYATPFYNVSRATRTILFRTRDQGSSSPSLLHG